MRKWNELSIVEQLGCIYSDRFKDAYGVRPRNDISNWTEADLRKELAFLNEIIDRQIQEELV